MPDSCIGLFTSKPAKPDEAPKPVAKAKAKAATKQQQSYEELELKLIKDIGDNIGVLFDTQQQITNFYLELEETSKTDYDPTQNTSKKAIERALIELQLEKLMEQTREAMVYAPPELKDLYSRFLKMHARIEQEQAWARSELIRRNRLARWQKEQDEIRTIETTTGVIGSYRVISTSSQVVLPFIFLLTLIWSNSTTSDVTVGLCAVLIMYDSIPLISIINLLANLGSKLR